MVATHVELARSETLGRPVVLLGESMGGLLALAVAQRLPAETLSQVIMVNPATSFSGTLWPLLGPALPGLPVELYNLVPFALAPILGDPIRLAGIAIAGAAEASLTARTAGTQPPPLLDAASDTANALLRSLSSLGALAGIIPPSTLAHRLAVLSAGSAEVNASLDGRDAEMLPPVLIVVGDADRLLPSAEEGPRLARKLSRSQLHVVKGGSHMLLQEGGLDIAQLLREKGLYMPLLNAARASAGDAPPPPPSVRAQRAGSIVFGTAAMPSGPALARAREPLATLRRLVSPVFFSTAADGRIEEGLHHLPTATRPLLFVANHQLFAPDLGIVIEELLIQKGVLLRGLAHPAVFASGDATTFTWPGAPPAAPRENTFQVFGAVPVSGKALFSLLSAGEAALLFPGGVREAYKRRGEQYQLLWPRQPEFVRHAMRLGATIVPFAAVGAEDAFDILADADAMLATPLLGDALRRRAESMPSARAVDTRATADGGPAELFLPPLVVPRPPARYYFRFSAPRRCSNPADADDPDKVAALYADVKADVEEGIAYLLKKRGEDPFQDLALRVLFEAAAGRRAPTFKP